MSCASYPDAEGHCPSVGILRPENETRLHKQLHHMFVRIVQIKSRFHDDSLMNVNLHRTVYNLTYHTQHIPLKSYNTRE